MRLDKLFASAKPPIKGMLREAERQLKSSLQDQDMAVTYLELVKVYRLDLYPATLLYFVSMTVLKERESASWHGMRGVDGIIGGVKR